VTARTISIWTSGTPWWRPVAMWADPKSQRSGCWLVSARPSWAPYRASRQAGS